MYVVRKMGREGDSVFQEANHCRFGRFIGWSAGGSGATREAQGADSDGITIGP